MTDQELLEKAARAAGIEIEIYTGQGPFHEKLMRRVMPKPVPPGSERKVWNPIQDDGDALRLAVKLNIFNTRSVGYEWPEHRFFIDSNDDPFAATRRAITRAAAAMADL